MDISFSDLSLTLIYYFVTLSSESLCFLTKYKILVSYHTSIMVVGFPLDFLKLLLPPSSVTLLTWRLSYNEKASLLQMATRDIICSILELVQR
jgi:hypothetical protein